ncbi:MAG: preprotein translocase subunit SecA [Clostridiales Family XIII bacterium]|jgi:preprotein translocase subunit SecA|nr:preprotein translocase subunit SecA [Clostridiales Family XIII bacterium]
MGIFDKVLPDLNKREVAKLEKVADRVLALDEQMQALSDAELRGKTEEFKARVAERTGDYDPYLTGAEAKEQHARMEAALEEVLPEAFAVCREAAWRSLGMKHFPVQIVGGIALHKGNIAEMKTGEGKTLVATLPAYLNALSGRGVHVVTVNDYLAKRDMEWMGKLYSFLGLSVGCVIHAVTGGDRKKAYQADITYGTNNEFGFDYLRDNMVKYAEMQMQRPLNFAIVDEVDSILIDEARTPLIISGTAQKSTEMYTRADRFVRTLKAAPPKEERPKSFIPMQNYDDESEQAGDFILEEKDKKINLTESGIKKAEKAFGIENFSDPENIAVNHHIMQALKANYIMKNDVDYVVKDGEIIIVDEFTGRLMFGRRYSEGLHQAIEAKEGLTVKNESMTLATITIQNYFRMYQKLSGMTGTAKTEEEEFVDIYNMNVIVIPTNRPVVREDADDVIYRSERGKFEAIVEEITETHKTGQPVLVGTISIEKSEHIADMLKKRGVKHNILNAKHHEREALIVAQAGRFGAVTIATNMAGRGTDIILGGNPDFEAKQEMAKEGYDEETIGYASSFVPLETDELRAARARYTELLEKFKAERADEQRQVVELGGLHIIGTERHESRRIDNQLRGRSGRQGDPGSTRFFISMEDELLRLFGGERMQAIVDRLGVDEETPIEAGLLSKSIENAQKKVEGRNFGIRKYVLQYDNVMNKQREIIYAERKKVLLGEDMHDNIAQMREDLTEDAVSSGIMGSKYQEEWDFDLIDERLYALSRNFRGLGVTGDERLSISEEALRERAHAVMEELYRQKEEEIGPERMRELERTILLMVIDRKWMDHIDAMDQLKSGIGLRGYGQQDPAAAYAKEGFDMFEEMTESIKEDTVRFCYGVTIETKAERKEQVSQASEKKTEEDGFRSAATEQKTTSPAKPDNLPKDTPKANDTGRQETVRRTSAKIGRNDPCPCGSGKKYKNCCGKNA